MAFGALLRIAVSHVCRWVSTKPGITIFPVQSTTSASASMFASTAVILSSSIRTSPVVRSPMSGSTDRTVPPLRRILPMVLTPF